MSEVGRALADARLMVALRLRVVRSSVSRFWMLVGLLVSAVAVVVASNAGDILRMVVFGGAASDAGQLILTALLSDWVRDDFAAITLAVTAGAVAVSVASAIITASPGALISESDRAFMRPSVMSRFFEAVATQFVSVVVVVQLVAVTALASLLTMDSGSATGALLVLWAFWLACQSGAQVALWGSQIARRARWTRQRRIVALAAVSVLLVAVALLSDRALAVGRVTASIVSGPTVQSVPVAAGLLVVAGALAWAAWAMCAKALTMHPRSRTARVKVRRSIPRTYLMSQLDLQVRSLLRVRAITDPVVALLVIAWIATVAFGTLPTVVWGVGLGIPLTVALAYTRNALAVIGPSGPWLASLPGGGSGVAVVLLLTGAGTSVAAGVVAWLPAVVVRGLWDDPMFWSSMLTITIASCLMTVTSVLYAINHPVPARINAGEPILSPGAAIISTLRLLVFSGVVSWLATSGSAVLSEEDAMLSMGTQLTLTGAVVAVSVALAFLIHLRWQDQTFRARALSGAA